MGVREQALAKLAERQSEERAMVRAMTKRLDAADSASETARRVLAAAEDTRSAVLAEWAGQPGWTAEAVAAHAGLPAAEVRAVLKERRRRSPG